MYRLYDLLTLTNTPPAVGAVISWRLFHTATGYK
jgi:hypothetical protein